MSVVTVEPEETRDCGLGVCVFRSRQSVCRVQQVPATHIRFCHTQHYHLLAGSLSWHLFFFLSLSSPLFRVPASVYWGPFFSVFHGFSSSIFRKETRQRRTTPHDHLHRSYLNCCLCLQLELCTLRRRKRQAMQQLSRPPKSQQPARYWASKDETNGVSWRRGCALRRGNMAAGDRPGASGGGGDARRE